MTSNSEALASIVTALGGTPTGTNADLIAQIATLLGSASAGGSNAEALAALAAVAENIVVGEAQTKTVTPTTSKQNVTADQGKYLSKVTVNAVTSDIDANIVAGNIKSGVTILGVEGTYTGEQAQRGR